MSGHKKEEAKESLYKALGRRVVWEGNLNTFLPLSTPSVLDLGQPLSGAEFSPWKRGQPKSLEHVLLLKVSRRSLSRFLLCRRKSPASVPKTMTVLWATRLQKSSVPGSSPGVFFFTEVFLSWDGWDDKTSVQLLYFFPLLPLPPLLFFTL